MYSEKHVYEAAARRRRTDFLITFVIFAVFIVLACVTIFFVRTNPLGVAVGALCIVWLTYSLAKSIKKLPPIKAIFSKELKGEITAIEYVDAKSKSATKTAVITVRGEKKSVRLSKISLEAASAYSVGDKALVVAGTQYPMILGRESRIIPCPICGKVRPYTAQKCDRCGN